MIKIRKMITDDMAKQARAATRKYKRKFRWVLFFEAGAPKLMLCSIPNKKIKL